jgi:lipid-binding SYLF domain-containing protein
MRGTGVGGQAGIERSELLLIFRTRLAFDRALAGRLELGVAANVSAGPLGREAEIATDRGPRADIYSYSRTHGAFVGVSLAETQIHVDAEANGSMYGLRKGDVAEVIAHIGNPAPAVHALWTELKNLAAAVPSTSHSTSSPAPIEIRPWIHW